MRESKVEGREAGAAWGVVGREMDKAGSWVQSPASHKPDVVLCICKPRTREEKAGGSEIQSSSAA